VSTQTEVEDTLSRYSDADWRQIGELAAARLPDALSERERVLMSAQVSGYVAAIAALCGIVDRLTKRVSDLEKRR
jgi:ubiquinone biosynthesis protein UbiJ